MAQKKGVGSSRNGRDSNPKYLGVKMYGGQAIEAGNISTIRAWASASAATTPCSPWWTAWSTSPSRVRTSVAP